MSTAEEVDDTIGPLPGLAEPVEEEEKAAEAQVGQKRKAGEDDGGCGAGRADNDDDTVGPLPTEMEAPSDAPPAKKKVKRKCK